MNPRSSAAYARPDKPIGDGCTMGYIIHPDDVCNGFRADQGEDVAVHHSPADYTEADLLDQYRFADCPLHVNPAYPDASEGTWKRDVARAIEALSEAGSGTTPEQYAEVWKNAPHARWWLHDHQIAVGEQVRVCRQDGCTEPHDA